MLGLEACHEKAEQSQRFGQIHLSLDFNDRHSYQMGNIFTTLSIITIIIFAFSFSNNLINYDATNFFDTDAKSKIYGDANLTFSKVLSLIILNACILATPSTRYNSFSSFISRVI